MTDEYETWLNSLKAGDQVVVRVGWGNDPYLYKVKRTTATRVMVDTWTFARKTGYTSGRHGYDFTRLEPPTDDIRHDIWRRHTITKILGTDWQNLSDDTLKAVQAALTPPPRTA